MQFIMQPGMVYQYPIWGVGLLLVGLAALKAHGTSKRGPRPRQSTQSGSLESFGCVTTPRCSRWCPAPTPTSRP